MNEIKNKKMIIGIDYHKKLERVIPVVLKDESEIDHLNLKSKMHFSFMEDALEACEHINALIKDKVFIVRPLYEWDEPSIRINSRVIIICDENKYPINKFIRTFVLTNKNFYNCFRCKCGSSVIYTSYKNPFIPNKYNKCRYCFGPINIFEKEF